jgi:hypothetical protein
MSSASATHTKTASFAAPFRHTAFTVIWTATVVSNVGGWMYSAASGWLMTSLDPDPLIVALVQAASSYGKALGSYAGLASSPYSSGGIDREQGIGKAGNRRVRTVMVELAWLWTRYQPGAAQVCWFRERVGSTGRRVRKIMVVALARKLLIALWRFVIDGVLPEGAVLKPAA